jgi:hypothetical protein
MMADKLVTIVPKKGVKLPVSECILKKDDGVALTVVAAAKTGRGRGVKHVLRQFVIPKGNVEYIYAEKEVSAEEAEKYPQAGKAPAATRKTSTAKKAAASTDEGEAAPKKRGPGRPKGSTKKTAKKRGPGRPKKAAASTDEGEAAPKKRGPGRPKGSTKKKTAAKKTAKKRGPGRPKGSTKKATKKKAAKKAPAAKSRGSSLFEDF